MCIGTNVTNVVNASEPQETGKEETASPIIPEQTWDSCRDETAEKQSQDKEPPVLPVHNWVLLEITDISGTWPRTRLHKHPSNVRPE